MQATQFVPAYTDDDERTDVNQVSVLHTDSCKLQQQRTGWQEAHAFEAAITNACITF